MVGITPIFMGGTTLVASYDMLGWREGVLKLPNACFANIPRGACRMSKNPEFRVFRVPSGYAHPEICLNNEGKNKLFNKKKLHENRSIG